MNNIKGQWALEKKETNNINLSDDMTKWKDTGLVNIFLCGQHFKFEHFAQEKEKKEVCFSSWISQFLHNVIQLLGGPRNTWLWHLETLVLRTAPIKIISIKKIYKILRIVLNNIFFFFFPLHQGLTPEVLKVGSTGVGGHRCKDVWTHERCPC